MLLTRAPCSLTPRTPLPDTIFGEQDERLRQLSQRVVALVQVNALDEFEPTEEVLPDLDVDEAYYEIKHIIEVHGFRLENRDTSLIAPDC